MTNETHNWAESERNKIRELKGYDFPTPLLDQIIEENRGHKHVVKNN